MPSTNGHGPRRAALYRRVSGDEQKTKGYSYPTNAPSSSRTVLRRASR
jgi:hypothetical protein